LPDEDAVPEADNNALLAKQSRGTVPGMSTKVCWPWFGQLLQNQSQTDWLWLYSSCPDHPSSQTTYQHDKKMHGKLVVYYM
jgi:D-hexose-6-phosphate mutarotase